VGYNSVAEYEARSIVTSALTGFSTGQKQTAIDQSAAIVDSYIGNVTTLPLSTFGEDVRGAEAKICDYELLSRRGYNPDGGGDANVRLRYEDALRWLEAIARGSARLLSPDNVDAATSSYEGSSFVVTRAKRGW
jgi:phage gp36-like protein